MTPSHAHPTTKTTQIPITGDVHRAAAQFAYLVAGEPLDRAMLVGTIPSTEHAIACARDGVQTFLLDTVSSVSGGEPSDDRSHRVEPGYRLIDRLRASNLRAHPIVPPGVSSTNS